MIDIVRQRPRLPEWRARFVIEGVGLAKVRMIAHRVGCVNTHRFHGQPPGTVRLECVEYFPLSITRRRRPLFRAVSHFSPAVPGAPDNGACDFNTLPLGARDQSAA